MPKQLITCDCSGTFQVDQQGLGKGGDVTAGPSCSALCTRQIDVAEQALTQGEAIICCTQETTIFNALAEDMDLPVPAALDLRDRAGWSADPASKLPKMSALLAEALLPAAPEKTIDITSHGMCLITGPRDAALLAAEQLKDHLAVTVVLEQPDDAAESRAYDVVAGTLRKARGSLGQFQVTLDRFQHPDPSGRGTLVWSAARDGAMSECDIILDLRGQPPLFPAHEKRDGYLRADPKSPAAMMQAVLAASHLVGTFEKPLYVRTDPMLCAHSRAEQSGCSRCLDLCPTGAITPSGDHISIDPQICAGCGGCSSVCPSGAISYDAPPVDQTMHRVQTLAKAYLDAGGTAPRLMVHDDHGAEMIRLSARHGRGLPADVIPMQMSALGAFGHAEMLAALAAGFASVSVLPGPAVERDAMGAQIALARALSDPAQVLLLETSDPDAMSNALYSEAIPGAVVQPVRPMGTRRQITRQAARALHPDQPALPLPEGAPYGAVLVDTDSCTLCLSCVSLCPSGALGDNPDAPQLRFQEDACLQCGLCSNICPEDAITLKPQLNLADNALSQEVLNEEEPFACVECGSLFGVKSTIDRITEKLSAHPMFQDTDKLRTIQMCDDCRVNAQFKTQDNPFQGGTRPLPRTTSDYLSKRRDH